MTLMRQLRKMVDKMAKNGPKKGKSARNGNAPSPYQKYGKTPHKYSQKYTDWRRDRLAGRVRTDIKEWKADSREQLRDYKIAAE